MVPRLSSVAQISHYSPFLGLANADSMPFLEASIQPLLAAATRRLIHLCRPEKWVYVAILAELLLASASRISRISRQFICKYSVSTMLSFTDAAAQRGESATRTFRDVNAFAALRTGLLEELRTPRKICISL